MAPYEERRRKYIDNLKLHGKFDDFKKKRAQREKERRVRLKEALAKMSLAKRNQLIEENRVKNRKGVQKFRMRKNALQRRNITTKQPPKSTSEPLQAKPLILPSTQNCQNPPIHISIDTKHQTASSQGQQQSSLSSKNNDNPREIHNKNDSLPQPSHEKSSSVSPTTSSQETTTSSTEICKILTPAISNNSNSQSASTSTEQHNELPVTKSINFEHSYKTPSALSKAVAKANQSLPSSPSKRKAVMARLLRTFSEEDQRDIIGNRKSKENGTHHKGLSVDLVQQIRQFYERDDVSRISPNVKDARKFVDPDTGEKVVRQIRHLSHKLSEVYSMFLDEYKDNEADQPPVKLSKFCALRPEYVFLMSETPRNVCFCLYHSNFIQCAESLHKNIPEIPDYCNYELVEFLVCDVPTRNCYFKTCKKCSCATINKKIKLIAKQSRSNSKKVKWMKWVKDDIANRFQNHAQEGSQDQLIQYFLSIYPKFLQHFYIKREQEKEFAVHRKRVESNQHLSECVLQIDFAENFKCESQDEVQQAHYNQKQITIFTTALHHAQSTHSKVIASDNTHHGKETLVAYLYTIFEELSPLIKTVNVWSDGPSSQFKNKFIAAIIPVFEVKFGVKIVWNFFATSHGKSCIDGIGAAVKSKVKKLILARAVIVNDTNDFVAAFKQNSDSKIDLIEVNDRAIDKINKILNLNEVFAKAPAVRDISKFHKLLFVNKKAKGFIISADAIA